MPYKSLFFLVIATFLLQPVHADTSVLISSPDGNITLAINHRSSGEVFYAIGYKGRSAIGYSTLGFKLNVPEASLLKFELNRIDSSRFDQTWKPVWGEQSSIRNNYKQLKLKLTDRSGSGITLNIVFRVFNDGVGFRYEFPMQQNQYTVLHWLCWRHAEL